MLVLLVLLVCLTACGTSTVGKYTLTQVSENQTLIDPTFVKAEGGTQDPVIGGIRGTLIKPKKIIRITMNRYYTRYLQAIARPELALYVRVRVIPEDPKDELAWETILVNTEDQGRKTPSHIQVGKESAAPFQDMVILPPLKYSGESIVVEIRAIELDKEDNLRWKALLSAAATVGALASPTNAAAISVAQTALVFVSDNNPDDIEFAYDLGIHPGGKPFKYRSLEDKNVTIERVGVLQPRIGQYVLIKTEDRNRKNLPDTYTGFVSDGVRWSLANALRLGTLNAANWFRYGVFHEETDPYSALFGHPFAIDRRSARRPQLRSDGLHYTARDDEDLIYTGGRVVVRSADDTLSTFVEQAHVVLTIDSPKVVGQSVAELRAIAKARQGINTLDINTKQLSGTEMAAAVKPLVDSLSATLLLSQLRKDYDREIAATEDAAEIRRLEEAYEAKAAEIVQALTPETRSAALDAHRRRFSRRAERRLSGLAGGFRVRPVYFPSHHQVVLSVDTPSDEGTFSASHAPRGRAATRATAITAIAYPNAADPRRAVVTAGRLPAGAHTIYLFRGEHTGSHAIQIVDIPWVRAWQAGTDKTWSFGAEGRVALALGAPADAAAALISHVEVEAVDGTRRRLSIRRTDTGIDVLGTANSTIEVKSARLVMLHDLPGDSASGGDTLRRAAFTLENAAREGATATVDLNHADIGIRAVTVGGTAVTTWHVARGAGGKLQLVLTAGAAAGALEVTRADGASQSVPLP